MKNKAITESHYEDRSKYVIDTQTGEVVDGPFERYSEIPLRLMGFDGGHKVVSGAELNGRPEEDLDEAGYGSYVRSYNNNRTGFSRPQRDMSDESNLMYVYREERLKQGMIDNPNRDRAHAEGFRDTPEQALRLHGIIRSKFDPKKWIQKQGTKWVEVHPYGKDAIKEAIQQFEASIDSLIGKYK